MSAVCYGICCICNFFTTCDVIRSWPPVGVSGRGLREADILAREVDHYAVLGVTTDATEKQLKTAYRMKSLKFHPDKKGGHTAAFQRIAEAYEVPASSLLPLLPRLQLQLHFLLVYCILLCLVYSI
jgi:hypothetical protein